MIERVHRHETDRVEGEERTLRGPWFREVIDGVRKSAR